MSICGFWLSGRPISPADLANLMNEAAILAARKGQRVVTMAECEEAIDRVLMGPEHRKRVLSDKDKLVLLITRLVMHYWPITCPMQTLSTK